MPKTSKELHEELLEDPTKLLGSETGSPESFRSLLEQTLNQIIRVLRSLAHHNVSLHHDNPDDDDTHDVQDEESEDL